MRRRTERTNPPIADAMALHRLLANVVISIPSLERAVN
jgi:hypothetical protein